SGSVHAPQRLTIPQLFGAQVSLLFEPLKERIQASGADAVAMSREFLDHAEAEDGPFHSVMENVQADQTGIQIPIRAGIEIGFRLRHSITKDVTTRTSGGAGQLRWKNRLVGAL